MKEAQANLPSAEFCALSANPEITSEISYEPRCSPMLIGGRKPMVRLKIVRVDRGRNHERTLWNESHFKLKRFAEGALSELSSGAGLQLAKTLLIPVEEPSKVICLLGMLKGKYAG